MKGIMKTEINELEINGEVYVKKSAQQKMSTSQAGLPRVIVAAGIGGIHYGYLKSRKGQEVVLSMARRIQYWNGAASITEMASRGVSKPKDCRFSAPIQEITLLTAVEILPVSEKAANVLDGVDIWTR